MNVDKICIFIEIPFLILEQEPIKKLMDQISSKLHEPKDFAEFKPLIEKYEDIWPEQSCSKIAKLYRAEKNYEKAILWQKIVLDCLTNPMKVKSMSQTMKEFPLDNKIQFFEEAYTKSKLLGPLNYVLETFVACVELGSVYKKTGNYEEQANALLKGYEFCRLMKKDGNPNLSPFYDFFIGRMLLEMGICLFLCPEKELLNSENLFMMSIEHLETAKCGKVDFLTKAYRWVGTVNSNIYTILINNPQKETETFRIALKKHLNVNNFNASHFLEKAEAYHLKELDLAKGLHTEKLGLAHQALGHVYKKKNDKQKTGFYFAKAKELLPPNMHHLIY